MIASGLLADARALLSFLDSRNLPACIIGGLAVVRWGEPRLTVDVDVSVLTGLGREREVAELLLGSFRPRVADALGLAERARVLLLTLPQGTPADVALAAFPFESDVMARASEGEIAPGHLFRTCSAEDLIIYKCVAGRPRDQADVEGIVLRQHGRLDLDLIRRTLAEFADLVANPRLDAPFEAALKRAGELAGE